jgi:hypothetical protein
VYVYIYIYILYIYIYIGANCNYSESFCYINYSLYSCYTNVGYFFRGEMLVRILLSFYLPSLPTWHMTRLFFFFHFYYKTKSNCSHIQGKKFSYKFEPTMSPDSPLTLTLTLSLSPATDAPLSVSLATPHSLYLSPSEPMLSLSSDEPTISLRPQLRLRRQQTQLLAYSPRALSLSLSLSLSLQSLLQVRRLGISDFWRLGVNRTAHISGNEIL